MPAPDSAPYGSWRSPLSAANAVRRYLRQGRSDTARYLAQKALVGHLFWV